MSIDRRSLDIGAPPALLDLVLWIGRLHRVGQPVHRLVVGAPGSIEQECAYRGFFLAAGGVDVDLSHFVTLNRTREQEFGDVGIGLDSPLELARKTRARR